MDKQNKFELSPVFNIWNKGTRERIEISEDVNGLGLIEVRFRDDNNKIISILSFTFESAKLLQKGLDLFIVSFNKIKESKNV